MGAAETKERILDAAFAEFSEFGVAGARVDRIAAKAGCNKNLIYVYFENKETLFSTVLERHLADTFDSVGFTPDDLAGSARKVFDRVQQHPEIYRLLAWATLEGTSVMPPARSEAHARKLAMLREHQAKDTVTADLPPELLMMAVLSLATAWSPVFPFGASANPGTELDPDQVREAVATMVARIAGQD